MNILYYINPWIEKENPSFRFGSIKNIVQYQIKNLLEIGENINISLILGESTYYYLEKENIFDNSEVDIIICTYKELIDYGMTYTKVTSNQFNNVNQSEYLSYIENKLEGFYPEFIISWEHPIDFLSNIYPNAIKINLMPGMYSRDPFPELTQIDFNGLFSQSALSVYKGEIENYVATDEELLMIQKIRETYIDSFYDFYFPHALENLFNDLTLDYKYNILLPLQVSNYFSFNESCEFENQFDFLYYVLTQIPKHIGVIVTQYNTSHTEDTPLTIETLKYLNEIFPNLIYSSDFEEYENISQLLLKYCDGVVTVSSSIGLQSLLWRKPVFTLGMSHLNIISETTDLLKIEKILNSKKNFEKDAILSFLLTRLHVLTQKYLRDDEYWFYNFLLNLRKMKKDKLSIYQMYKCFDSIPKYTEEFIMAKRENITLKKLPKKAIQAQSIITKRSRLLQKINKAEIVSFDIFDTLVERPFTKPVDLFRILDKEVIEVSNNKIVSFSNARTFAERKLKVELNEIKTPNFLSYNYSKKFKEEVTLDDIYEELQEEYGLTNIEREEIKKLEISNELYYLLPKKDMIDFYNYALKIGKKVILISDMYLPEKVIIKILNKNEIFGYEKLYLSSTINLTKHKGTLFNFVLKENKVNPKDILHIGDNPQGDEKMAWKYNFVTHRIKKNLDHFFINKKMNSLFWNKRNDLTLAESAVLGLIAKNRFNNEFKNYFNETHFNQSSYNLGYIGLGWMFYSFSIWLIKESIRDGIDTLYFLSRDGLIMKNVYDKVKVNFDNPPKSIYLYGSRRACQVASIKKFNDIIQILNTNFTQTSLYNLFLNKFGVDIDEIDNIEKYLNELNYTRDSIVKKQDIQLLIKFASKIKFEILQNSKKESLEYLEYLKSKNIATGNNAVVDIGYAGTMQKSIINLANLNKLGGYYFMTFLTAKGLKNEGQLIKGFAGDFIDKKYSNHPICKLGLLFEVVFSNTEGSLLYFMDGKPILESTTNEYMRKKFIKEINTGIIEFITDFNQVFSKDIEQFEFDNYGSLSIFTDFLENPSGRDTDIMLGVNFDDSFGTTNMRYMLPLPGEKLSQKEILWKKGYEVYNRRGDIKNVKSHVNKNVKSHVNKNVVTKYTFENKLLKFFLNSKKYKKYGSKKYEKYCRDRESFFLDSNNKYVRIYYRLLGSKL